MAENTEKKEWHNVPDGKYTAYLNDIIAGETKSGKPRLSFVWRIVNGPERGYRIYDNVTMSEIGADIAQKKLAAIAPWSYEHNVKLTYEEEAEQIKQAVSGVRFNITVHYNDKGFVSVYCNGRD